MLACGGTNADHLLLWIHNSCKDALLIQLKKKKEQSTKMQEAEVLLDFSAAGYPL